MVSFEVFCASVFYISYGRTMAFDSSIRLLEFHCSKITASKFLNFPNGLQKMNVVSVVCGNRSLIRAQKASII